MSCKKDEFSPTVMDWLLEKPRSSALGGPNESNAVLVEPVACLAKSSVAQAV